jgi:hypothetical protein
VKDFLENFREKYLWVGVSHASGALAIQALTTPLLGWWFDTSIFFPSYWWMGATAASLFFIIREIWQWRRKKPPVWWQNRFIWDAGTAVMPVVFVALVMGAF